MDYFYKTTVVLVVHGTVISVLLHGVKRLQVHTLHTLVREDGVSTPTTNTIRIDVQIYFDNPFSFAPLDA